MNLVCENLLSLLCLSNAARSDRKRERNFTTVILTSHNWNEFWIPRQFRIKTKDSGSSFLSFKAFVTKNNYRSVELQVLREVGNFSTQTHSRKLHFNDL